MTAQRHTARTDNVTRLPFGHRKASLSPLRQVEAYWHALCPRDTVPHRSQVDPRGLQDVLDHVFLLERVAPGVVRFRLAGRTMCDAMGMELRGMPLSCLFAADARDNLASIIEHVLDAPAIGEVSLASAQRHGRFCGRGQMVLLPLQSGATPSVNRILGACVLSDATSPRTSGFSIQDVALRPVSTPSLCPASAQFRQDTPNDRIGTDRHLRLVT